MYGIRLIKIHQPFLPVSCNLLTETANPGKNIIKKASEKDQGDYKEVIFEGDIEEAEQWLFTKDFSGLWDLKHPPMHFNCPCAFIIIECPPFRRNAEICALLCIIVMLVAYFTPNKELGFYLGFPGLVLLFLAFSNAVRHFRWERNKM